MDEETQIKDLNIECQLLILNELDVSTLISLSQTSKHFFFLVEDVLKRRFAKKTITFNAPHLTNQATETSETIHIRNIEVAKKLMKFFGHLMVNVQFHRHPRMNSFDFFPNEFTTPLEKVEHISLHGRFNGLSNRKLQFFEIFPALRSLSVFTANIRDMSWVDHTYPHLESLNIYIWNVYDELGYFNPLVVERLMVLNPQIRKLVLGNLSRKLLNSVATNFPNLEMLELQQFGHFRSEDAQLELHFDKLKVLKMQRCFQSIPNNATFEALEEFETDGLPAKCKKWIHFIENNKNLKRLRVTRTIDNAAVSQLSSINSNLVEIKLLCGKDVDDKSIIELIENNKELRKIQLIFEKSMNSTIGVLQSTFRSGWIIEVGKDYIILEK